MTAESSPQIQLADQLDRALSSMWSGNAGALDELVEACEDGVDAEDRLPETPGFKPESPPWPVGEALRHATARLGQSNGADWTPQIPGFDIQRELGRGGMGMVWLARQERLRRLVALKVLPHAMSFSPRMRSRFQTETHAIAKVRHPNIVNVYDVVESEGVLAYAMEWVEGSTLAKVIERAREGDASRHSHYSSMACVREALGWPAHATDSPHAASGQLVQPPRDRSYIVFVCRVGVAIARALGEVHRAGLVHRDVKPSNILLRRDGTPLLSDFGLVRDPDSTRATQTGSVGADSFAGTAAYAAPEQLRAERSTIDGRADIYALGATLYSALALRVPFDGHNHLEVLRQIQHGLHIPLRKANPKLPKDLQTIVSRAMELDPKARYQTADELADDLERLLNLQPIKARPASAVERGLKLMRRNRGRLIAGTLGGALAMGIVALVLVFFIGFPIWSKGYLDQARLGLLDPEQSDALFSVLFWTEEHANGLPISAEGANRALANYDAAARLAPFDGGLALERDLVRLARDLTRRESPSAVTFRQSHNLPLTASLASQVHAQWTDYSLPRSQPSFSADQLHAASSQDLRSLGLLALLCGAPAISMSAWTALDLQEKPDALVEASFGVIYLISDQPGRAYPRLRKAVEAFPNTQFLTVYLAEAAARCGDVEKAQQWLDQARLMDKPDRFNGLTRVQAFIFAAGGKDDQAIQLYVQLSTENKNVVAYYQYGEFLESRGELESALVLYQRVIDCGIEIHKARRRFVDVMEQWWEQLSAEKRAGFEQEVKNSRDGSECAAARMRTYVKSVELLEGRTPPGGRVRDVLSRE